MSLSLRSAGRRLLLVASIVLIPSSAGAVCDPDAIAVLVTELGSGSASQRWDSSASLGRCGAAALPALTKALADANAAVRQGAARALGGIGPAAESAVPALVTAIADHEPLVRESAAEALGRVGPAATFAIAPLVASFADDDPYLAGAAAIALGRIGVAAVPALTDALADPRENVRWSAAIALGRLGAVAAPAVPALAKALGDEKANVRTSSAYALGAVGEEARAAVPALTELLHDRDEDARRAARTALGQTVPLWRSKPPTRDEVVATIDRLVPMLMEEQHVPGVQIALIEGGKVAWSKSYGVSDATTKAPVTNGTLFEAASMSKPVFAILAMQLVDERRLDLDVPLTSYASELAVPAGTGRDLITARLVLAHKSGLPNWRPGDEEREGPLPLLFPPGARFSYSGEGMFYLQRVTEQITGRPLDLDAREKLFDPLGLRGSSFVWTPEVEPLLASGHGEDGALLTKSKYRHPNSAYSLYTTADEYGRILTEVMKAEANASKLLSQSSVREMLKSQVSLDAREPMERPGRAQGSSVQWGLGWSMNQTGGGMFYHHSGANRTGFRCYSQFSMSRRTGLVIMTNGLGGGELWTRLVATIGDF